MKAGVLVLVAGFHMVLAAPAALAQTISSSPQQECLIQNFREISQGQYSLAERIAINQTLTDEQFETLSRSFNMDALLPVDSVPVRVDGRTRTNSERRAAFRRTYEFSGSRNETLNYANSYLTTLGAAAYQECLRTKMGLNEAVGLNVRITSGGPNTRFLRLEAAFNTTRDASRVRSIIPVIIGGKVASPQQEAYFSARFQGNRTYRPLTIERNSLDEDLIVDLIVQYDEQPARENSGAQPPSPSDDPNGAIQISISKRPHIIRFLRETETLRQRISVYVPSGADRRSGSGCVYAVQPDTPSRDRDWRLRTDSVNIGAKVEGGRGGIRSCQIGMVPNVPDTENAICRMVDLQTDRGFDSDCSYEFTAVRVRETPIDVTDFPTLAEMPNLTYALYTRVTGRP